MVSFDEPVTPESGKAAVGTVMVELPVYVLALPTVILRSSM
jgi:hypothetical protein